MEVVMSAAIRSTLQKLVFQPDGERLIAVANLKEAGKSGKRKETYACLVVTLEQPVSVRIHFVKSTMVDSSAERKKDSAATRSDGVVKMKKKQQFALREVKVVDGINPRKATADFSLTIGSKEFHLSAANLEDKELFIRQLYRLAKNYLPVQKPEFVNLSLPVEVLVPRQAPLDGADGGGTDVGEQDGSADYQPISAKEEADFRHLLAKSNLSVGEAKKFAAVLNEQLVQLDSANMGSIMGSERQVTDLLSLIDNALGEADAIEKQLDEYDAILAYVRDSVELIEEKASLGHVERNNAKRLMQELADFIYLVDTLDDNHIQVLRNADLSDPKSINLCCQAARVLSTFQTKGTKLSGMHAYQAKMEALAGVAADFVDKLFSHLTAIFANMESMLEAQSHHGEIIMQKHSQRHHALLPFADLLLWLKTARPAVYSNTMDRYRAEAGLIYRREFERFFNELSQRATMLSSKVPNNGPINEMSFKGYAELLETAVAESRAIVESEQKFSTRFFHINAADLMAGLDAANNSATIEGSASTSSTHSQRPTAGVLGRSVTLPNSSTTPSGSSHGSSENLRAMVGGKSLEKHLNDHLRAAIGPIFDCLPIYVQRFTAQCQQYHPYVIIALFVVLTRRLSFYQDSSSYFSVLYGSMLVAVKRLFDEQMKQMEQSFSQIKLTKRARVGLLESISSFKALMRTSSAIFADSERRIDLDKWAEKLSDAVEMGINAAATSPHSKYPAAVVRMENFHHFYSALSELKMECLDTRRRNAKRYYQEALALYVHEQLGRPLERIHLFFELVERSIENGVKPEEVGYEPQYSRMELRKVLSSYPAKEVKKGLEGLYKKVEKHLTGPQSPLLQVVWRDMQDEFLKQLKHYQQLIGRCYSGSRVELEVSIQEVLQLFSEIAQQH